MVDEETPLTGISNILGKRTIALNTERIRFFGLLGGAVLLLTGYFVSNKAVVFPPKDDPSSFLDKVLGKAPSDFDKTQTFIFKLFHFNHTCSVLDFNPSKTISALVIMFHTLPLDFFVICHYFRITGQSAQKYDNLKKVTKVLTPIQFVFFTYFYMVFVNSPDGEFGTKEGMQKFILHYTPYVCWQVGMFLMAIQQCWFLSLKDLIPFPFVTPTMMKCYLYFMWILLIVYTYFCVSFIVGSPAWDTTGGFGRTIAITIMYTWDFVAVIIPTVFAWFESKGGDDLKFTIEELH